MNTYLGVPQPCHDVRTKVERLSRSGIIDVPNAADRDDTGRNKTWTPTNGSTRRQLEAHTNIIQQEISGMIEYGDRYFKSNDKLSVEAEPL